jgi:hypothetical protein
VCCPTHSVTRWHLSCEWGRQYCCRRFPSTRTWKDCIKYEDDNKNNNIINYKRETATLAQMVWWLYCQLNSPRFESAVAVFQNVQTGSRNHPASYSVSTGDTGVYSGRGEAGHTLASSAEVKNEWSCSSSPAMYLYAVYRKSYTSTSIIKKWSNTCKLNKHFSGVIFLHKQTLGYLFKKLYVFYVTRRSLTIFTKIRNWFLFWVRLCFLTWYRFSW